MTVFSSGLFITVIGCLLIALSAPQIHEEFLELRQQVLKLRIKKLLSAFIGLLMLDANALGFFALGVVFCGAGIGSMMISFL